MDFSPDKIRARFHELTAARAKIDKKLDPLREELNALVAGEGDISVREAAAREPKLRQRIRDLQTELAPIETERALCARALGGQTGEPS